MRLWACKLCGEAVLHGEGLVKQTAALHATELPRGSLHSQVLKLGNEEKHMEGNAAAIRAAAIRVSP